MKRRIASFFCASELALAMMTRTVWSRSDATSLPRATSRILPCSRSSTPSGGDDQPISIWPDITAVHVLAELPVAVGLSATPDSLVSPSTMTLVEEPVLEKAMVFPAASLIERIGESARTYQ